MRFRTRVLIAMIGLSLAAAVLIDVAGGAALRSSLRTVTTERLERESALLAEVLRPYLEPPAPGETAPARPRPGDLQPLLDAFGRDLGHRLTLIAPGGDVLADSEVLPSRLHTLDNHADRPEVREALASGTGRSTRRSATVREEMTYVARRIDGARGPAGVVRVAVPTAALEAGGGRPRAAVAAMALGAFLALSALAYSLTRSLSAPIERIARAADRAASGRYDAPIPAVEGPAEAAALAAGLERMRRALLERIGALREERRLHDTILSGMHEGLLAVDASRRVMLANAALRRDFDVGDADVRGRPLLEVVRDPEVDHAFSRTLAERSESRVRAETRFPAERSFEVLVAPLTSPEGGPIGAIGIFLDVTRLQALERMRREFIADVSHELRTPLASLKAAVENLSGAAAGSEEDRAPFLAIIRRNSERMEAVIGDLTDLSLIETGAITLDAETIELREAVADVTAALAGRAAGKGVTVESKVPPGLRVRADRRRLDQVLVNVIDNAVKFNRNGGSVLVTAAVEGTHVVAAVEDTGPGVPPEDLERIFQRFYRRDRGRSREAGGTGLGLAIVKHLVRLQGGSVRAEPRQGGGLRMIIALPATNRAGAAPRPPSREGRPASPRGVLFLCTGNSCRSQMAEAFGRLAAPAGVEIFSAGTDPRGLDARAVTAMKEAGVDISGQTSKGLVAIPLEKVDTVVTLCGDAAESCPSLPGRATLHWDLPDPASAPGSAEETMQVFRAVRDEIRGRVRELFR